MPVAAQFDRQAISPAVWRLIAVLSVAWSADAFDAALGLLALPAVSRAWNLGVDQVRWLLVSGQVGLLLGALVTGLLADRYGRRPLLLIAWGLYPVATALVAIVPNLPLLALLRLLAGVGLGSVGTLVIILLAEVTPTQQRGRVLGLLLAGGALSTLVAALLVVGLTRFGWPWLWLAGGLPILTLPWARRTLVESPRWLLRVGRTSAAAEILRRLGTPLSGTQLRQAAQGRAPHLAQRLAAAWLPSYRSRLVMLSVLWFGMACAYVGIVGWPLLLPLAPSLTTLLTPTAVVALSLGGAAVVLLAGWLADWIGRKRLLLLALPLYGLLALLLGRNALGLGATPNELLIWSVLANSVGLGVGGLMLLYTVEQWPTILRGLGVGWAVAAGRLGTIAGLSLTPWLLDPAGPNLGGTTSLLLSAIVVAVCLAMVAWLGPETPGRTAVDWVDDDPLADQRPAMSR